MGNVAVRIPVSMRLPADVAAKIEAYAAKANMRKTDAYLHFLQLGLKSAGEDVRNDRLSAMEARLDEILALMKGGDVDSAEQTIARIRRAVSSAARGYPAIRKAYLFGSIARRAFTDESDIDLRLVVDHDRGFNLHDLEHFCKEVERETGRAVDAVTARSVKGKGLAAAIERGKVLMYEREERKC